MDEWTETLFRDLADAFLLRKYDELKDGYRNQQAQSNTHNKGKGLLSNNTSLQAIIDARNKKETA